jgi:hypothetical protein
MLSINFWTPLVACGVDAPGLKVIPLGVAKTKSYLEYNSDGHQLQAGDFAYMAKFRCSKMELAALEEHDLIKRVWAPEFNAGDVLAFTNFTMHATHHTKTMSNPRTSVEVRIDLPGVWIHRDGSILNRARRSVATMWGTALAGLAPRQPHP